MRDPIDVADEVFMLTLQVADKCAQCPDAYHLAPMFRALAEQLSDEVADSDPLHLIWVGATIQGIKEEILEAAEAYCIENPELTGFLDNADALIGASMYNDCKPLDEDKPYELGD